MPHIVNWLIENCLVLIKVSGDVSVEDAEVINAEVVALLRAGEPPVHVLSDLTELRKFPFDLIGMRRALSYLQEPNLGWVMAYGPSSIASSFARLLTSLVRVRLRFVRDQADALNVLAGMDARIKALIERDSNLRP